MSAVLTSSLTVLVGVSVYVIGQILAKFFIEPIHEQARLIGEIAIDLIFYANVYCNPGGSAPEKMDEASEVLRQKASLLRAKTHAVPWYVLFEVMRFAPKLSDIIKASGDLIGLSNSVHRGDPVQNDRWRKEVEKLLNIRTS